MTTHLEAQQEWVQATLPTALWLGELCIVEARPHVHALKSHSQELFIPFMGGP